MSIHKKENNRFILQSQNTISFQTHVFSNIIH